MADGKVVIETDLDSSGIEKRVKKYRKINEGSSGNSCGRISETGDECERCIQKSVE